MQTSIPISGLNELLASQLQPKDFYPIVESASLTTFRISHQSLNSWFGTSGSVLSASWASQSISASYSVTSSYAVTTSWAFRSISSSYASRSLSASYAVWADWSRSSSFSSHSLSSSFNLSSSWATRAGSSISGAWAFQSVSSSYADHALSASYSDRAQSSSYARSASYAMSASAARSASVAYSSSYALSASYARSASVAISCSYAQSASYSHLAQNAFTASFLLNNQAFTVGMVIAYCNLNHIPPPGWLECDGELYDPFTYVALAQAIGQSFGANTYLQESSTPESMDGTYHTAHDGTVHIAVGGGSGNFSLVWSNGPHTATTYYLNTSNGQTLDLGGFPGWISTSPTTGGIIYAYTLTDIGNSVSYLESVQVNFDVGGPWSYSTPLGSSAAYRTPLLWNRANHNGYFVTNFPLDPWMWIIKY